MKQIQCMTKHINIGMNPQIQKLAQDAGMYVDVNGEPWPRWMGAEECEAAYAKFAELIVAECIQTIQMGITRDGHNTEKYLRSIKHIEQIKEHFGVEQ